jgi:hypothetical protein
MSMRPAHKKERERISAGLKDITVTPSFHFTASAADRSPHGCEGNDVTVKILNSRLMKRCDRKHES